MDPSECPPGRDSIIPGAPSKDATHYCKKGARLHPPFPEGTEMISLGMGCFWCSENLFMKMDGVYSTQAGYQGGVTKNPTYNEICTGTTNHAEVVRVVYHPAQISCAEILSTFWSMHDPTTPFQQGGDCGTQYRSAIYYYSDSQRDVAERTMAAYGKAIAANGVNAPISTEVGPAPEFFIAEESHQQYDAKPGSRDYCGLRPLGIPFPADFKVEQ